MESVNIAKSILVIDDDQLVIRSVERYLKACGYNVETAQSGDEALERAKDSTFGLIISDIRMPGMDGFKLNSCKSICLKS